MKNFKFSLLDQGIHIRGEARDLNGKDYLVSLLFSREEKRLPWKKAVEWTKEQGGTLPTRAQWISIQEHRDEINAELEKAELETIGGWCWTSEEYAPDNDFAWCVGMYSGGTDFHDKGSTDTVRAVSAFPAE